MFLEKFNGPTRLLFLCLSQKVDEFEAHSILISETLVVFRMSKETWS